LRIPGALPHEVRRASGPKSALDPLPQRGHLLDPISVNPHGGRFRDRVVLRRLSALDVAVSQIDLALQA
jgi:hypothetical protein